MELTDSRDEHDTEASKYGKLVSYSKETKTENTDITFVQCAYNKLNMSTQI